MILGEAVEERNGGKQGEVGGGGGIKGNRKGDSYG